MREQNKDTFDATPVAEDAGLERAVIKAVSDDLRSAEATFREGQRFRIKGASSVYGTVVVRPYGEGQRIGIPVIMDGDRFVTYRALYEMQAL